MHPDLKRDLLVLLRNPALGRLLDAFHKSLTRSRVPRGRHKVDTREEIGALQDLIGKRVKLGGSVALAEVDRLLRENTRFHCSLEEALELHLGEPIVRPKETRAQFNAEWQRVWNHCFEVVRDLALPAPVHAKVVSWLHGDAERLRRRYRRWGGHRFGAAVRAVTLALARAPGPGGVPVFLTELAAEVAGGQHGLDKGKPAGLLLYYALAYEFPDVARRGKRGSPGWRSALLSQVGIARDPISSRVDTYGLAPTITYFREMRTLGLDRSWNLRSVGMVASHIRAWRDIAFVVENPTVYAALLARLRIFDREFHPTLVCTNGNLNLADLALLDILVQNGAHVFYNGDFDTSGLEITAQLLARHPNDLSPWRMEPADYQTALASGDSEQLDPVSLQRLAWDFPSLVPDMVAAGRIGDQENLIPVLMNDLARFISDGTTPPRRGDAPGHSARISSPG